MREDIYGGLKNALERGATLEQAIQSFINAGYNEADVREASRSLQSGTAALSQSTPPVPKKSFSLFSRKPVIQNPAPIVKQKPQMAPIYVPPKIQPNQVQPEQKPHFKIGLVTILVVVLMLLVVVFVASLIFREKIAEILQNLLT